MRRKGWSRQWGDSSTQHSPSLHRVFAGGPALASILTGSFCPRNVPGEPQSLEGKSLCHLTTVFDSDVQGSQPPPPAEPRVRGRGCQRDSRACLCPGTCPQAFLSKPQDNCRWQDPELLRQEMVEELRTGPVVLPASEQGLLQAGMRCREATSVCTAEQICPYWGPVNPHPTCYTKAETASAAGDAGRITRINM